MRKEKRTKHNSMLKLFDDLYEYINESASGTYNNVDPTHWSKGYFYFHYDTNLWFKLEYYDCTWGVEYKISRVSWSGNRDYDESLNLDERIQSSIDRNRGCWLKNFLLGSFYDTRDGEIIIRQNTKGLIKLLHMARVELLKTGTSKREIYARECEWDDPMGCISDYI